jgi:tRNA (cmo5U34)-methyltransferase
MPLDGCGGASENRTMSSPQNSWTSPGKALEYLQRADTIPHRAEGEATLLEFIPQSARRVLDLGSGAGRLLGLVRSLLPLAEFVALDFSSAMIEHFYVAFPDKDRIQVVKHDMQNPLPALGIFDAVVSSFAIHHLTDNRKRGVYAEVFDLLTPGGVFCNLEHVASPSEQLHLQFLEKIGLRPDQEDAENKLLDVQTQIQWLREIGFSDVDCHWKWREFALLVGVKEKSIL